jgi:hypothetical protein
MWEFADIARRYRTEARATLRKNQGFTSKEVGVSEKKEILGKYSKK